jgi:hypothetical protein
MTLSSTTIASSVRCFCVKTGLRTQNVQVLRCRFANRGFLCRNHRCLRGTRYCLRFANLGGSRWYSLRSVDTTCLDVKSERAAYSCLAVNTHLASLELDQFSADELKRLNRFFVSAGVRPQPVSFTLKIRNTSAPEMG